MEPQLTPEQKQAQLEAEEDEYFEQMLTAFQASDEAKNYNADDDIEFFRQHPLTC